ncbi:hypothetical protein Sango_3083900 [Sesamum angolense]|uniref:Reverse transcriptase domain-containing protein n=1 Tax=Sesamum angolense TaxID=2727404 RepID=A0AAE1T8X3_9LAMI|nr:hypothetical protein Sango_3083900 [Sesamum angolense]
MQRVLHLLIDYSQNAFVSGRNISDTILLAQELLAGYNQAKLPPRCTIKIDLQKAYDSVEWDFLIEEGFLPVKYLGVPLISSRLTMADCKPLIDKLDSRIAGWNHLNLTYAGRAQLIKINGARICESSMGTRIQFGLTGLLSTDCTRRPFGLFMARQALWGWKKMIKLRPFFQRGLQYKVGDGLYFQLWQDIWHERGPLCVSYSQGPNVTGLPIDTLLSRVMRHGQWNWPTSTDPDFNELATQLSPIYANAIANHGDQIGQFSTQSACSLFQPNRTKVECHTLLHGSTPSGISLPPMDGKKQQKVQQYRNNS